MNKLWAMPILFAASQATAGGWEASKLDTSFMYQEGGYAELSYGSVDYSNLKGNALYTRSTLPAAYKDQKTAKNQTRISGAFKMSYGNLDVGLSSFRSGTIQMQGGAGTYNGSDGGTVVPDADADLNTTSFVGKYNISENYGVIFAANQNSLSKTRITTILGDYDVKAKEVTGFTYGFSYSQPEIALRVELLYMPKSELKASSNYTPNPIGTNFGLDEVTNFTTTLSRPETTTVNFQSGIAENTLLFGSVHKAAWKKAQIYANTNVALSSVVSQFKDTTEMQIGLARKISDSTALIASYTSENGYGKTHTSTFTQSNGKQGISLAVRYNIDNLTITGGYTFIKAGDVSIFNTSNALQATYKNNEVSALGLKLGVSF